MRIHSQVRLVFAFAAATAFGQRGPAIQQQLAFTPYHANGIYNVICGRGAAAQAASAVADLGHRGDVFLVSRGGLR